MHSAKSWRKARRTLASGIANRRKASNKSYEEGKQSGDFELEESSYNSVRTSPLNKKMQLHKNDRGLEKRNIGGAETDEDEDDGAGDA